MKNSKNRKTNMKFNIIDIAIVLVIVIALALVGVKVLKSKIMLSSAKTDTIQTVVFCEEVPDYAAKTIKIGDVVNDPYKNIELGHITDVKINDSICYGVSDEGKWIASPKPNFSSIYITLTGKGIYNDEKVKSGVTFDNSEYWIGKYTEFRVGDISVAGRISEMKKTD